MTHATPTYVYPTQHTSQSSVGSGSFGRYTESYLTTFGAFGAIEAFFVASFRTAGSCLFRDSGFFRDFLSHRTAQHSCARLKGRAVSCFGAFGFFICGSGTPFFFSVFHHYTNVAFWQPLRASRWLLGWFFCLFRISAFSLFIHILWRFRCRARNLYSQAVVSVRRALYYECRLGRAPSKAMKRGGIWCGADALANRDRTGRYPATGRVAIRST
jgi:hypothetical protein